MSVIDISFPDVLGVTGAYDREICHWARDGLIPGMSRRVGSGNPRRWTRDQIRHTRALRLVTESNPHLNRYAMGSIAQELAVADWSVPFVFHLTRHVLLVIDLPTIDAQVAELLPSDGGPMTSHPSDGLTEGARWRSSRSTPTAAPPAGDPPRSR